MREGYRVILESENPDGFTCEVCQDSHKDEDSARECCDAVIYTCAVCDQTHIDEYSAENCCDSVRKGTGRIIRTYQCNWCYRKHITQITAKKCCPERNYKCSNCGELFTIQQFMNNEICSCERRIHQVILF